MYLRGRASASVPSKIMCKNPIISSYTGTDPLMNKFEVQRTLLTRGIFILAEEKRALFSLQSGKQYRNRYFALQVKIQRVHPV